MSAGRAFWDAVDQTKRGGGARLTPAMPPAAAMRQFIGMTILDVHEYPSGDFAIELSPRGHMSRRMVLVEDATNVRDITFDRDDGARPDDEQAQIDIGDDIYEREREDRE